MAARLPSIGRIRDRQIATVAYGRSPPRLFGLRRVPPHPQYAVDAEASAVRGRGGWELHPARLIAPSPLSTPASRGSNRSSELARRDPRVLDLLSEPVHDEYDGTH